MKKKIIVLILSVIMVFGILPMTVFAADAQAPASEETTGNTGAEDPALPETGDAEAADPETEAPAETEETQKPEDDEGVILLFILVGSFAIASFSVLLFLLIFDKAGRRRKYY